MDKKEVLKQIKAGDLSLEDVDKTLRADKEVVLAAVKQDADALEYADKKFQKEFKTKNEKSEEQVLPEIFFSCPELTYYDLTVEEKDLNSIEKIRECPSA